MKIEEELKPLMSEIAYSGFADVKEADVREKLESGDAEFSLPAQKEFGIDKDINATAALNFRRAGEANKPYFNNFDVTAEFNGMERSAKFYKNFGNSFTFKESVMLLTGGSVTKQFYNEKTKQRDTATAYISEENLAKLENHKSGEQIPSAKLSRSYNINVEELVSKLPLADETNQKYLIEGLQRGETRVVSFDTGNGSTERHFVRLNGQYKNLDVYDSAGEKKLLSQEGMNQYAEKTAPAPAPKLENKGKTEKPKNKRTGHRQG